MRSEQSGTPGRRGTAFWLYVFFGVLIVGQLALAFTRLEWVRVWVRGSSFGISLLLLLISIPFGRPRSHPASRAMWAVVALVALSLFHPTTNGWISGGVQVGLYLAILAPLVWVPRFSVDFVTFRRALLLLWAFHTASAAVGIVQVYSPDTLQPNISSVIQAGEAGVEGLKMTTSTGEVVLRPMGLSDVPGGAAVSGLYATLLGAGIVITRGSRLLRLVAGAGMLLGMASIYLSQVRSVLVVVMVTLVALTLLLFTRRRVGATTAVTVFVAVAALGGFALAISLAGDAVIDRLSTLAEVRPTVVYYESRGGFLESTATLLGEYPLGAGLGRWGMTHAYFGERTTAERGPIWVEIQWTGWVVDGGAPLVVAYVLLLFLALRTTLNIPRLSDGPAAGDLNLWSALVSAYTIGIVALTFSYPIFASQTGMEFWAISASIFSAATLGSIADAATGHEGTHENLPDGRGRLRSYGRNGHGEPGAGPIPGGAWRSRAPGEPPGRG